MPERKEGFLIALVGDIALQGLHLTEPEKNEERFLEVGGVLKSADMVFANLEVPIAVDEERNEEIKIIHAGDAQVTERSLRQLNVGCVSLANNHVYDCKMSGLEATIDLLDGMGVLHTGAGWKQEHVEPVIINLPSLKLGFAAYVDKSTRPLTKKFPEVMLNYFELEKARSEITLLKKRTDKVICSIHWGRDYSFYPTAAQMIQARSLIDAGADIIMGHHPHVLQGYERYNGGHIFYSLGNLTYGDFIWEGRLRALKRKTKRGTIARLHLAAADTPEMIALKELPGNRIVLNRSDTLAWMRKKMRIAEHMVRSGTFRRCLEFKEIVIDRGMEFCFGYYRNPFADVFSKIIWSKLGFFKRDYIERKKG